MILKGYFFDRDGTLIYAPVDNNNKPNHENLCQIQLKKIQFKF